jgi:hypothetical protein
MPISVIRALAIVKKAAAQANVELKVRRRHRGTIGSARRSPSRPAARSKFRGDPGRRGRDPGGWGGCGGERTTRVCHIAQRNGGRRLPHRRSPHYPSIAAIGVDAARRQAHRRRDLIHPGRRLQQPRLRAPTDPSPACKMGRTHTWTRVRGPAAGVLGMPCSETASPDCGGASPSTDRPGGTAIGTGSTPTRALPRCSPRSRGHHGLPGFRPDQVRGVAAHDTWAVGRAHVRAVR